MVPSQPSYLRYWGKARPDDDAAVTWHPAAYHMLDVAAVGVALLSQDQRLARRLAAISGLAEPAAKRWLFLCLALHDLGKFFPYFQNKGPELHEAAFGPKPFRGSPSRHDRDGLLLWDKVLKKNHNLLVKAATSAQQSPNPASRSLAPWIKAALCHHGRPWKAEDAVLSDRLPEPFATDTMAYVADILTLATGIGDASDQVPVLPQTQASWLVAGLSVLCDWLGSNKNWFDYHPPNLSLADYWQHHAIPNAQGSISEASILAAHPSPNLSITALLPASASPSPLQEAVQNLQTGEGPTLAIIEDQTGAGKTEAALILAGRMMANGQGDGLFIALPTMATANAMYRRCEKQYRHLFAPEVDPTIVLAHSKRDLVLSGPQVTATASQGDEAGTAGTAASAWISDDRRKSALADCGISTVDQAVMAVLPSFYQSLRLAGLARKILVLDEVHAHDPYLGGLVAGLLRFHAGLGGSAILLSATLPAEQKRRYAREFAEGAGFMAENVASHDDAYPQITLINASQADRIAVGPRPGLGRTVTVERLSDEQDAIKHIVAATQSGQAVAWIRNTVADAVRAAEQLRQHLPAHLFHARFAMGDRLERESQVEALFGKTSTPEQRHGRVLVATQVAEQSLDIDFDLMVSDLAPIDSLIQRAGRLWRHARPERQGQPKLLLFSPDPMGEIDAAWYARLLPKAAHVYQDPLVLWRTARELMERGALILPEQARDLIEAVYNGDDGNAPPALQKKHLEAEGKGWGDRATANAHLLRPDIAYDQPNAIWDDEIHIPTRLGEAQSLLRLARWQDGRLSPWCAGDDAKAWRLSEVTMMRHYVAAEAQQQDPALRSAIEQAKRHWPGPSDAALLIPLSPKGEAWTGTTQNGQDLPVILRYHPETGLEIVQKSD
ncbi:MAG: CRISPR-associated helicase Cas3' [Alphaproteobacteria bacterium]|nr:CRISPR-associated helicase Cas3' [Alphaproteobacteria bacterium]